ncbi:hypothetical protein [Pseudoalteromonas sp. Of7M-16]|uniref:hypothetical protein n=1 Tax=Pseudoalteromonas sp. Of7M-16 TaxID=2917756 RepID=UPI001EF6187C|nr:hypothetical protein [Pseudoalteromonas sp. Of7M-16]MCG7550531.1 hypothetical protein [Pseudoalteromonas sp. Of7M-16]
MKLKLALNKKSMKQLNQKQLNQQVTDKVAGGTFISQVGWCGSGMIQCWTNGPCL